MQNVKDACGTYEQPTCILVVLASITSFIRKLFKPQIGFIYQDRNNVQTIIHLCNFCVRLKLLSFSVNFVKYSLFTICISCDLFTVYNSVSDLLFYPFLQSSNNSL